MKKLLLITLVIMLAFLTACGSQKNPPNQNPTGGAYQTAAPEGVKLLLDKGKNITLVDVGTSDEYKSEHIPGAILLPGGNIGETQPKELPDLNAVIIVYSHSSGLSKDAAEKLLKLGYVDVRDLGSIADWPYDTVSGTAPGVWGDVSDSTTGTTATTKPTETTGTTATTKPAETTGTTSTVKPAETTGTTSTVKPAETTGTTGTTATTKPTAEPKPEYNGILSNFYTPMLYGGMADESILVSYELTMVNVWATFCPPCIEEMPELGELAAEYKNKGVQIVGVVADVQNYDGSYNSSQISLAKDIAEKTNANYTHLLPSEDLYPVLNKSEYVPTTIFVDKYGNQVGEVYVGARSKEAWASVIEQMLALAKS